LRHGREVGCDVDGIGDNEKGNQREEGGCGQLLSEAAGKPSARLPSDAGADDLYRRHERQGEKHCPAKRVSELCPGLRVGGDATWIVVGRAGDKARSERAQ